MLTYKNLYSYMISHVSGKGNEVVLTYNKRSKTYNVVKLVAWVDFKDPFT